MVLANPLGTLLPWALNAGPQVNKPTVPTAGNLLPQTGSTVPRGSVVPTTVSSAMAPKGPGNTPSTPNTPNSSSVQWPGQSQSTQQNLPSSNPIPGMGPYSGYGSPDQSAAAKWYAGVGQPLQPVPKTMGPNASMGGGLGNKALAQAFAQVGDAYTHEGKGTQLNNPNPTGFDCSGLTRWAYHRVGIELGYTADAQYKTVRAVDRNHLQVGDLVFFNFGRLGTGHADHVAMYAGNGKIVSASNPRVGVVYRDLAGAYMRAVIGAGRPT